MRQILSFIFILFLSCSAPNNISWDKTRADNVRHIGSTALETQIDNATYSFNLTVFSGPNVKYFCLLISSLWRIENDGIVLFKLSTGETIKLTADNTNVGQIDWPTYSPIIGGTKPSGIISTKKADYYSSIYVLPDDILSKIETHGIIKIRIQFGTKYKEQTWPKDKLGKHIKSSHALLEQQLKTPGTKLKSIEQGF